MSILSDILAALDRWAEWKSIRESPAKIEALEKRIVELETRLQRAPGKACPSCGDLAFRVERSEPRPGWEEFAARQHHWKCGSCGYTDVRKETPT